VVTLFLLEDCKAQQVNSVIRYGAEVQATSI